MSPFEVEAAAEKKLPCTIAGTTTWKHICDMQGRNICMIYISLSSPGFGGLQQIVTTQPKASGGEQKGAPCGAPRQRALPMAEVCKMYRLICYIMIIIIFLLSILKIATASGSHYTK